MEKENNSDLIKLRYVFYELYENKNEYIFIQFMKNYKNLDNYLSLIVGIPNNYLKSKINIQKMFPKQYKKHLEILGYFIHNEYNDSFKRNFEETAKQKILQNVIPIYGSWNTLIKLINKNNFYKIINIFNIELLNAYNEKRYSNSINSITNEIKKFITLSSSQLKEIEMFPKKEMNKININENCVYNFIL